VKDCVLIVMLKRLGIEDFRKFNSRTKLIDRHLLHRSEYKEGMSKLGEKIMKMLYLKSILKINYPKLYFTVFVS